MNHNLIIDTIIKNDGIVVGSYVREWIGNGYPKDNGWNDIDIKCPIDKINEIKNKIKKEYPNIKLDFMPSFIPNDVITAQLYTCNFFKYDGDFKILDYSIPVDVDASKWLEFTKDKIYYAFLDNEEFYKRASYQEEKLNKNGWKFAGLNKFRKV
jgi:hypothetical protein